MGQVQPLNTLRLRWTSHHVNLPANEHVSADYIPVTSLREAPLPGTLHQENERLKAEASGTR